MNRWAALPALAAAVVIGLVVSGDAGGAVRAPAAPISASTSTATGSSVVFAMGHLRDPLNTFWELFLRPAGSSSWTLQTPPGVASNGGLVLAASPSGPLTVGFLTSQQLTFSPLAESNDDGATWSAGELPSALTPAPDALAVGSTGDVLALVGTRVLRSTGDLAAWNTVTTASALRAATSSCGVQKVTAVAYNPAGQPLLGLSCAQGGHVGILVGTATSTWHDIGPSLGRGASAVSRLERTPDGVAGLAQVQSGTRSSVVAFWGNGSSAQWAGSATLSVPAGWSVKATATGGGSGEGLAVLLGSGDTRRVAVVAGPGASWVTLPPAPRGASAVSVIGTEVDAFVVASSKLAVWRDGAAGWDRSASITVPVPYGSSS
jgi:hypothetical protein